MNHISVLHTKKLKEVKKVFLLFGPVILLLIIELMETGKQSHVHTNELFVVLFYYNYQTRYKYLIGNKGLNHQ